MQAFRIFMTARGSNIKHAVVSWEHLYFTN